MFDLIMEVILKNKDLEVHIIKHPLDFRKHHTGCQCSLNAIDFKAHGASVCGFRNSIHTNKITVYKILPSALSPDFFFFLL